MDNQAVEAFVTDQNPDGNNQNKAIFLILQIHLRFITREYVH